MDGIKRDTEIKIRFSLISLILFNTLIVVSRPAVFKIVTAYSPGNGIGPTQTAILSTVYSLTGILQTFVSVLFVMALRTKGFWIQLWFNVASILSICVMLVVHPSGIALSGFAGSLVSVFVAWIVNLQFNRIQKDIVELDRIAFSDDLTGLANRKKVVSVISNLTDGGVSSDRFSILFIDMDNFKVINDSLGHQIGDIFLNEVVHNIRPILADDATFGRMGGDEFLITVPGDKTDQELMEIGRRINEAVSLPFLFKNRNYIVTCCVGVARYPQDARSVSELLRFSDIALYEAKQRGRNRTVLFDDKMRARIEQKIQMEHELHNVLENRELYIEFQPQFYAGERRLRGFEVLTRWNSPILGRIPPSVFIPLSEENGDIIPIGKWIMLQSFSDYMKIYKEYDTPPVLAVNVSIVQFRDPAFLDDVKELLMMTNMPPENLEFEITESVCLTSPDAARKKLEEIHEMGIRIALDDFGTGYSSLSYLRTLPFDILKIDKSFIDTILVVPERENLVQTIITMAHQLGLKVIAEGVEQSGQMDFLVAHKCDFIQGFSLSRPVPVFAL